MAKLAVNIDHVATVRQARRALEPDPITAALLAELAGCDGIIAHLREDRRHICDRDIYLLKKVIKTKLNLEMAATEEMIAIASEVKPALCTLVPEKRQELTTEGGLDVLGNFDHVGKAVEMLHQAHIRVSLFIDPAENQIKAARETGADIVEIHTGTYSNAIGEKDTERELKNIASSASFAASLGFGVSAGHGLDYRNICPILGIEEINEFSIGHSIIARAILVGFERAVREMILLIKKR